MTTPASDLEWLEDRLVTMHRGILDGDEKVSEVVVQVNLASGGGTTLIKADTLAEVIEIGREVERQREVSRKAALLWTSTSATLCGLPIDWVTELVRLAGDFQSVCAVDSSDPRPETALLHHAKKLPRE